MQTLSQPRRVLIAEQAARRLLRNQDLAETVYTAPLLDEALEQLKGRCLVAVDKFWKWIPEITACIRRHGMEEQVLCKIQRSLTRVFPFFRRSIAIFGNGHHNVRHPLARPNGPGTKKQADRCLHKRKEPLDHSNGSVWLYFSSILIAQQKICNVHCDDAFIVSTGKFISMKNVLRIIITDFQKPLIFTLFGLFRCDPLRNLHIDFLILAGCDKIYLAIPCLSNMDRVSAAAQFQINNIFQTTCYRIIVVTQNAVSQGCICQVELFLGFQNLLALQIIARAAMQQISFFQLFQITINGFVVY